MLVALDYDGPNVCRDLGIVFLSSWLLYCVLYFDGYVTNRPDRSWLDRLGYKEIHTEDTSYGEK